MFPAIIEIINFIKIAQKYNVIINNNIFKYQIYHNNMKINLKISITELIYI